MTSSLFHVLNISRQDMLSKLTDLDSSANNLANVNTIGYKPTRSNFQELYRFYELRWHPFLFHPVTHATGQSEADR